MDVPSQTRIVFRLDRGAVGSGVVEGVKNKKSCLKREAEGEEGHGGVSDSFSNSEVHDALPYK